MRKIISLVLRRIFLKLKLLYYKFPRWILAVLIILALLALIGMVYFRMYIWHQADLTITLPNNLPTTISIETRLNIPGMKIGLPFSREQTCRETCFFGRLPVSEYEIVAQQEGSERFEASILLETGTNALIEIPFTDKKDLSNFIPKTKKEVLLEKVREAFPEIARKDIELNTVESIAYIRSNPAKVYDIQSNISQDILYEGDIETVKRGPDARSVLLVNDRGILEYDLSRNQVGKEFEAIDGAYVAGDLIILKENQIQDIDGNSIYEANEGIEAIYGVTGDLVIKRNGEYFLVR